MARRPAVRYRALVLGRTKLAEQDIIVTLLTSEGEQLRAVAKGGRKPGSRLAARTELFVEAEMLVSPGRGLGIITEAEVVDAHPGVRGDVERVACGSAMCEVARLTSYEDVEDPFMFHILRRALHACEQAENRARLDLMVAAYVLKVVSHGGWRPVLDVCVACGEPMIAWIAALVGLTFDNLLATSIDGRTAAELLDIAHRWAATHLEARLRAMEFLRGI